MKERRKEGERRGEKGKGFVYIYIYIYCIYIYNDKEIVKNVFTRKIILNRHNNN